MNPIPSRLTSNRNNTDYRDEDPIDTGNKPMPEYQTPKDAGSSAMQAPDLRKKSPITAEYEKNYALAKGRGTRISQRGVRNIGGPLAGKNPALNAIWAENQARQTTEGTAPTSLGYTQVGNGYQRPPSGLQQPPRRSPAAPMFSGIDPAAVSPSNIPQLPVLPLPGPGGVLAAAAGAGLAGAASADQANRRNAATAARNGIVQGINDAKVGITQRGPDGVTYESGATISGQPGQARTLQSPYGSGSVTFLPAGQRPSDPKLVAEINSIKARQGGLQPPTLPAGRAPTPVPAPQQTFAQKPPAVPQLAQQGRQVAQPVPSPSQTAPVPASKPATALSNKPSMVPPPIVLGNRPMPDSSAIAAVMRNQTVAGAPSTPANDPRPALAAAAMQGKMARAPLPQKVGAFVAQNPLGPVGGAINEGVPKLAGAIAGAAQSGLNSAAAAVNSATAPIRNFIAGSSTPSQAEIDLQRYDATQTQVQRGPVHVPPRTLTQPPMRNMQQPQIRQPVSAANPMLTNR